jgi:hypothetical protein
VRHVEPFLKLNPTVLDYEVPSPPKGWIERTQDLVEPAVDYVGGWEWVILVAFVGFVSIGVSTPGPIGASMVMIGAVLARSLLKYWSKSSRW